MPWVRLDDGMPDHPKMAGLTNAALGAFVRGLCYCARYLTDGVLPAGAAQRMMTNAEARALVAAGVLVDREGAFVIHDYLDYQPSKADVLAEREQARLRMELGRDKALRDFLRRRDGDRCRYCGRGVRWTDRRGSGGATYDHVDPEGGSGPENLVIACRGCNSGKGRRTPEQAGMTLHPPGWHLDATQVVSRSDPSQFKRPDPVPDPIPGTRVAKATEGGRAERAGAPGSSLEWQRLHAGPHVTGFCDFVCFPKRLLAQFSQQSGQPEDEVLVWALGVRSRMEGQVIDEPDIWRWWKDRYREDMKRPAASPGVTPSADAHDATAEYHRQREAARAEAARKRGAA